MLLAINLDNGQFPKCQITSVTNLKDNWERIGIIAVVASVTTPPT